MPLPTHSDVLLAAGRILGRLVRTPLLRSDGVDRRVGREVWVKAEGLQVTGSFKARGALNRLLQLSDEERMRGVVAFSSGNHGRAVAWAARQVGTSAVVVVPSDAPSVKIEGIRSEGAEVVLYDRRKEDRMAIGRRLSEERGLVLVPPYDDPRIIAGAGTLGLELMEQAGFPVGDVLVPCGGGGLTAGCGLALPSEVRLWAVEPADLDDTRRSLASGVREANPPDALSICDSLMTPRPGEITFELNRGRVSGALVATDDEVREGMRVLFSDFGLVSEPGGAAAFAALLAGRLPAGDGAVVAVVTGANVDPALFAEALQS